MARPSQVAVLIRATGPTGHDVIDVRARVTHAESTDSADRIARDDAGPSLRPDGVVSPLRCRAAPQLDLAHVLRAPALPLLDERGAARVRAGTLAGDGHERIVGSLAALGNARA